jgi:PIN domain nuclease of toxin-antitoxin system
LKVLLDTHSFLWFVLDDPKLSVTARQVIESGANEIYISPASFWEIAIKISLGRYQLNTTFETFWTTAIQQYDVTVVPIEVGHVARLIYRCLSITRTRSTVCWSTRPWQSSSR